MKLRYLILLVFGLSGFCHAQQPVVVVGYYDFPPSVSTSPEGRAEGPLVDLLTRLLQRAGYAAEFRGLPIARLYNDMREGRVDLWAGAPAKPELAGYVLESDRPLSEVRLNLYYRPDTPPPNVRDELGGKVVIMLSGYSYWPRTRELLFDPTRKVQELRTNHRASALALLLRKRGDYLLDYQLPMEKTIRDAGLSPLPHVTLEALPIRLIVSRKSDNAEVLLQRLDAAFDQMRAEGEDMTMLSTTLPPGPVWPQVEDSREVLLAPVGDLPTR